jgi:hypothetical protein
MNNNPKTTNSNFDLVRVSKSKSAVDVCPNTIRRLATEGLALYRNGRAVFFSKSELEGFIRARAPRAN